VIRTEEVAVPSDLPVFVNRGGRVHDQPMIFLAGMCVHPAGYIMSFARAAAEHGDILGLQGEASCGGNGMARRWTSDVVVLDRRIDAAFAAAGLAEPKNVTVIGYSQGAERAEKLVARFPEKYTRAILIASPITPSPTSFKKSTTIGVALMAGTFDISRARLQTAVRPLTQAGIHAQFFEIPKGYHGQLGDQPDALMADVLAFISKQTKDEGVVPE